MSDRIIFHADCNNFFASCECLKRPELKNVPMAVAGDPKNRAGVVVAQNENTKRHGVKTTNTGRSGYRCSCACWPGRRSAWSSIRRFSQRL